ncbi:HNH endonuclease family protein [Catenulispora yoronensis]|uniref:HNH endonuclease family protein n=1 Tax=Catenulispora yoronensis TaxID=450799 RepID=A0ABP5FFI2_9ACTN
MTTNRRPLFAVLTVVLALSGCKSTASSSAPPGSATGSKASSGTDARSVSPLANRDGLKPGLGAITSAGDQSQARDLITKLTTAATGPKTGYTREKFGDAWTDNATGVPFADNGCDTRDDVLARDGLDLAYASGSKCVLASMTLYNPYKSETIQWTKAKATTVQIDHVIPLSYAWQMGAARWSDDQRVQLANDPLNLLAVDGSDNASKGDSGPAEWLPPNTGIHCSYAVRFAEVALKYKLDVAKEDKAKMLTLCQG